MDETKDDHVRLNKFLASAGVGSRRHCDEIIAAGRVSVDGKPVRELGLRVDPEKQSIEVDHESVTAERKAYWLVNKPAGYLCTSRDTHGRPTVLDLLPPIGKRIYTVGRLDENSTGLILLTNDGEMANRLTHPRFNVSKSYTITVAGRVGKDVIDQLLQGVWLAEGKVRAREIHRLGSKGDSTRLRLVLNEGRNREIRRMFARFGHKVMTLERSAIGPIRIRRLPLGHARSATEEEVSMLRRLAFPSQEPEVTKRVVRPHRKSASTRRATLAKSKRPGPPRGPGPKKKPRMKRRK
ncbi:pseudouridine synthase [Planctomycetes bacterium Pan216]